MLSLFKLRTSRVFPLVAAMGALAIGAIPLAPMIDPTKRFRSAREYHISRPLEPLDDPREARRKRKENRPAWRR